MGPQTGIQLLEVALVDLVAFETHRLATTSEAIDFFAYVAKICKIGQSHTVVTGFVNLGIVIQVKAF